MSRLRGRVDNEVSMVEGCTEAVAKVKEVL